MEAITFACPALLRMLAVVTSEILLGVSRNTIALPFREQGKGWLTTPDTQSTTVIIGMAGSCPTSPLNLGN